MSEVTSFKKFSSDRRGDPGQCGHLPKGSKPLTRSAGQQFTISTGIPSLDEYLGGGLIGGSVNSLVVPNRHGRPVVGMFIKALIAQSVSKDMRIIMADFGPQGPAYRDSLQTLSSNLPVVIQDKRSSQNDFEPSDGGDMKMSIAWRYSKFKSNQQNAYEHAADFGMPMEPAAKEQSARLISHIDLSSCDQTMTGFWNSISESISRICNKDYVTIVVFRGLTPPSPIHADNLNSNDINRLLLCIKSLTRKAPNLISLLIVDSELDCNPSKHFDHSNVSDMVLEFNAFSQEETSSTQYKEFDGLVQLHKRAKINSFNYHYTPQTLDLGFKLIRQGKYLAVDKLSLPPDLGDAPSRSAAGSSSSTMSCSSAGPSSSKLDF